MVMLAVSVFADIIDPGPLVARVWVFALVYVVAGRALLTLVQRSARARNLVTGRR